MEITGQRLKVTELRISNKKFTHLCLNDTADGKNYYWNNCVLTGKANELNIERYDLIDIISGTIFGTTVQITDAIIIKKYEKVDEDVMNYYKEINENVPIEFINFDKHQ